MRLYTVLLTGVAPGLPAGLPACFPVATVTCAAILDIGRPCNDDRECGGVVGSCHDMRCTIPCSTADECPEFPQRMSCESSICVPPMSMP